jgi:hypothetical protein
LSATIIMAFSKEIAISVPSMFSFRYGYPVTAYAFFLVFSPFLPSPKNMS